MKSKLFGIVFLLALNIVCLGEFQDIHYKIDNMKPADLTEIIRTEEHIDSILYNNNNCGTQFYFIEKISKYRNSNLLQLINDLYDKYELIGSDFWPTAKEYDIIDSSAICNGFRFNYKFNDTTLLIIKGYIPSESGVKLSTPKILHYFLKSRKYNLISYTQAINKYIESIRNIIKKDDIINIERLQMIYGSFPNYREDVAKILEKL